MKILDGILKETKFQKPHKLSKFTVSLYNKDDHEKLIELYDKIFPGYMDENLWDWKNYQNPFGKFITILIKNKEKIMGAYSVAPKIFFINGIKSKCVQSMDTMTDKKYRGMGISTYLANLTYEYAKIRDYNFVYGFPNEASRYLFDVKLKWSCVVKSKYFVKNLKEKDQNALTIKKRFNYDNYGLKIKEVKIFDDKVNDLWLKNKSNYPIIIQKNNNYLNWRFVDHPKIKYLKYYIFDDTDNLISYFVLKKYKDENDQLIGHIIDYLIDLNYYTQKDIIFQVIENYSIGKFKNDCNLISFWIPDRDLQKFTIQKLGYKSVENLPFFGYKKFRKVKELTILDSSKNWFITMSNEDVF